MPRKIAPLRNAIKKRLLEAAKENGIDDATAEATIKNMESDRPLIDWFINGGFEKLIQLFLQLAQLFSTTQDTNDQPTE